MIVEAVIACMIYEAVIVYVYMLFEALIAYCIISKLLLFI